jgi:hypothetical protein
MSLLVTNVDPAAVNLAGAAVGLGGLALTALWLRRLYR